MGIGAVDSADLDAFVHEVDHMGGIASPDAVAYTADFSLRYTTPVDLDLDGFDPAYLAHQLALYRELADRDLDQGANELTPFDLDEHLGTPNPYATVEADRIAHHARTVLTSLIVADVPTGARVLDMGSGWGVSTEMFAFCGCDVTAVDINPGFVELVERRAAPRGYRVEAVHSSFDDFHSDASFDLVFFYECLHHAVRPWTLVEQLAGNVAEGGKIVFAGEPIQELWWPHWGLRLDAQSVYCARKFGWFESGWSAGFLTRVFERAGFELTLLPGIGFQHGAIGVASRPGEAAPPTAHWATPPVQQPIVRRARRLARRLVPRRR